MPDAWSTTPPSIWLAITAWTAELRATLARMQTTRKTSSLARAPAAVEPMQPQAEGRHLDEGDGRAQHGESQPAPVLEQRRGRPLQHGPVVACPRP